MRFVSVNGCTLQGKTGRTRRISDRGCIGLGKGTGDGTYLSTVAARDLPDPVGDSSSAFLTGSWSGVGVGV